LAGEIGERSTARAGSLPRAEAYLSQRLSGLGFIVTPHRYQADGVSCANLEVVIAANGPSSESVVVGAHYDSAQGAPGADDNASGVAVVLALAEMFRARPAQRRALRFVLFTNEEPPHFWNPTMGSLVFAKEARAAGQAIVAMLSIESVGFYRQERGTQKYPPPMSLVYPSQGDFVGFVGNTSSRSLLTKVIGTFREHAEVPSEGAALPGVVPGVGWSDHWSFWEVGYPAVMVTDTAPFRNPNYHTAGDRPDTLDYPRMAALTRGLDPVIERLRSEP
jgi:Zn-dependent M28 family amino/carboxypeptidase